MGGGALPLRPLARPRQVRGAGQPGPDLVRQVIEVIHDAVVALPLLENGLEDGVGRADEQQEEQQDEMFHGRFLFIMDTGPR